ncbi:MAG TPA: hypothetical protein VGJ92_06275 [Methanocella sp.]
MRARPATPQVQGPGNDRVATREGGMSYKRTLQSSLADIARNALGKRPAPIDEEEVHRFLRGGLAAK